MAQETKKYDEDYLNGLIAKAKKSWEGVDVDSFMSELRDMDAVTVKCRNLMVGDWCCNEHRTPMRITNVGEDYAYATYEGDEGYPWLFSDSKDDQPQPLTISAELLRYNGWEVRSYYSSFHNFSDYSFMRDANGNHLELKQGTLAIWNEYEPNNDGMYSDILIPVKYVHQLQGALRLAGLTDMANNFKV